MKNETKALKIFDLSLNDNVFIVSGDIKKYFEIKSCPIDSIIRIGENDVEIKASGKSFSFNVADTKSAQNEKIIIEKMMRDFLLKGYYNHETLNVSVCFLDKDDAENYRKELIQENIEEIKEIVSKVEHQVKELETIKELLKK